MKKFHGFALFLIAAGVAMFAKHGPATVTYFPSKDVSAAFVKGRPLIEIENYKIHASHRDGPGKAEVHEKDTDIVYVLSGTATLVTGGKAVNTETIAPEEIRGSTIDGGQSRRIGPGDVIVIPHGVPHLFKEVPGPLNYYVVKVRADEGGSR
jgi:mannose-6-phosphate isomerase-like protein (cupin superfamily)